LSQPGFPQLMVVDPNAVPETHWIAKRWPVTNSRSNHRYIRLAMRDNAHNLDASTIAAAEELYPVGHPLRLIKIEGRRGLEVNGTPVYTGAFVRSRHAATALDLNPELPLCEAYDYGFHHPCVVWYQWAPWGHLRVLGGVMGSDLHLDAFLPIVERYRDCGSRIGSTSTRRATRPARMRTRKGCAGRRSRCCGTGIGNTASATRTASTSPCAITRTPTPPSAEVAATQKAATYMRRRVNGEEAFLVDTERWMFGGVERRAVRLVLRGRVGSRLRARRRGAALGTAGHALCRRKDGWFEHPMNCFEYGLQAHVLDLPLGNVNARRGQDPARGAADAGRRSGSSRKQQQDQDPDERTTREAAREEPGRGIRLRGLESPRCEVGYGVDMQRCFILMRELRLHICAGCRGVQTSTPMPALTTPRRKPKQGKK
jgi:hypothetical protein